jgi:hypothetical protein
MTAENTTDFTRPRIASIVLALTGEEHFVTTEKRRGYWYAACGKYETDKGVNGIDAENGAVEKLLNAVEDAAGRVHGVGMLKHFAKREASMVGTENYIAGEIAKLQARLDAARAETAKHRDETATWSAKHCDDRARAVYDALTKYTATE